MIESVYFAHDRYKLDKQSEKKLDSLAQLKGNLRFRIFGNCDSIGSMHYNKVLSENRANVVNRYLQTRIKSNITLENVVGLGEEKQINDNSSEELRGKNRRVDIFIDREWAKGEKISGKTPPSFVDVSVSEMKIQNTYSLPNVNFIGGRHVWLPGGNETIVKLLKILRDNPTMQVELQGHICCDYDNFDGEDLDLGTFNLSHTRANSIKEFLQMQGIDSSRIKASGQGHLNPVAYPEQTDADRIKNRRVEIVLLKK
ncbi:OmpA family protein [Chryseobacterium paridis]|uniref:OmpA family protein n=1 Tax=Chryseobacterium paridis TaxID=2800328 RepID=A0ABS1FTT8_9FLAO|nr:OmpA family protein [Chryseobacterium paridis]MBK1895842.1 OmpA family protein [Chryseobacterium paridis]